jgi:hypothetical protein
MIHDLEELLAELAWLQAKDAGPFAYEDCRRLAALNPRLYHKLIPDLSSHFSRIAGYRSWGKQIVKWETDKLQEVENELALSFFDAFPEYKGLESHLMQGLAPDISEQLSLADSTRAVLRKIIRELLNDRGALR